MDRIEELSRQVLQAAETRGVMLALAESCTGGLLSATLTEIAGASLVVERGFVTYSNGAKVELLGVPAELIERDGAVSESVARAMAEGAVARSAAQVAAAITGVAGPGGSDAKPEGLVHIAVACDWAPTAHQRCQFGAIGRGEVRRQSVESALEMMLEVLEAV